MNKIDLKLSYSELHERTLVVSELPTNLTLCVPCIILQCVNVTLCVPCIILQCVNVTLCVPCIILQCVKSDVVCTVHHIAMC